LQTNSTDEKGYALKKDYAQDKICESQLAEPETREDQQLALLEMDCGSCDNWDFEYNDFEASVGYDEKSEELPQLEIEDVENVLNQCVKFHFKTDECKPQSSTEDWSEYMADLSETSFDTSRQCRHT